MHSLEFAASSESWGGTIEIPEFEQSVLAAGLHHFLPLGGQVRSELVQVHPVIVGLVVSACWMALDGK
jgi:hypothetical protein